MKESIWTLEFEEKGMFNAGVAVDWLVGKLDASGYHGVGLALESDNEPFDFGIDGRGRFTSEG